MLLSASPFLPRFLLLFFPLTLQITNPPPGAFERPPNLPGAAGNLCTSCEETPSSSTSSGVATGIPSSTPVQSGRPASEPATTSTPASDNDDKHKSSGAQDVQTEMESAAATSPISKSGSQNDSTIASSRHESKTDSSHTCPKTCSYNDLGPFTCTEVDVVGGSIEGRCDYKGFDLEDRAGCDCRGCPCTQI